MRIIYLDDVNKYLPTINKYSNYPNPVLLIGTTNQLMVYNPGKGDTNLEACEKYNAVILPYVSTGGTAVSNIGDLGIYFAAPGNHNNWAKYIFASIKRFLEAQGIKAYEEKNDILIYGKKVMGYTAFADNTYSRCSIFIAMQNSEELVNEICLKPKTRGTTGLNDYGITAKEIKEIIVKATRDYLQLIGGK